MNSTEIGGKPIDIKKKYLIISVVVNSFVFAGISYVVDLLFGEPFESLTDHLIEGAIFGVLFGIGFPFIIKWFNKKLNSSTKESLVPDLLADEVIENHGPANLFRGLEGVGGRLFLTEKRVVFKSHELNIHNEQTAIDFKQIKEVFSRKTARLINNGIRIKTHDGQDLDFVLNDRETWIEKLQEKIK